MPAKSRSRKRASPAIQSRILPSTLRTSCGVLLVDGDPQTSLVQSETFFLTRALNPAGERDSSLFLPTVVLPDGLNAANLDNYQVVILSNMATLPDGFVTKLQNFLRQGGGLLIFRRR